MSERVSGYGGHPESVPEGRQEIELYQKEADEAAVLELVRRFEEEINKIAATNFPPSLRGQKIINILTDYRLRIAPGLPYREDKLDENSLSTLRLLHQFEKASRQVLERNLARLFPYSPEETPDKIIDGALAEESAIRLVSHASPDARLYYPSEQDEHNGVDFFVIGSKARLAVQVKIVRYKEHIEHEHKMPLLYLVNNGEASVKSIVHQALAPDTLDYPKPYQKAAFLWRKIEDSLTKSLKYCQEVAPDGSLIPALMTISTSQINPRPSEGDIVSLEAQIKELLQGTID